MFRVFDSSKNFKIINFNKNYDIDILRNLNVIC